MKFIIQQEGLPDQSSVYEVIARAFEREDESRLVNRMRQSNAFVPELSLVAMYEQKIVGHILFSKIIIHNQLRITPSLALAPLAVEPDFQRQGVGSLLVREGLKRSRELGFTSVVVLGHEHYYPRFEFIPTTKWGIRPPFQVPAEVFMAVELVKDSLSGIQGTVRYPDDFFE
ncbi:N-acetyltransferase [Nibrella saemangeumensis]|uniref:N-acetyltransferase n=1 Tax=Nibrella saemangeumensis TaxID=1084526 RepID=A0ABP8NM94_9BACT